MSLIHRMIVDRGASSATSLWLPTATTSWAAYCVLLLRRLLIIRGPVEDVARVLDHRLWDIGTSADHSLRRAAITTAIVLGTLDTRWQALMDQLVRRLADPLATRRLVSLLSRYETLSGRLPRLKPYKFPTWAGRLRTTPSRLVRGASAMGDYWLLTESNDVLEVVRLSCVGPHWHVRRVEHQRAGRIIWTTSAEVELLRFATFGPVTCADVPSSRVEIYQVSWREIHVLHVCALLVSEICW